MLNLVGEAAVRTLLLAGAVQSIIWLLRVRRASLLLATWTAVLGVSIAMPLLVQVTPLRLPVDPALARALFDGAADMLPHPVLQVTPGAVFIEVDPGWSIGSCMATVYAFVGLGLALRIIIGVGLSMRVLARAVPIRAAWGAGLRVRLSRDVAGPVTVARVVLLPIDAVRWSVETRTAVLAHERAHVGRWDFAMLIGSQLNRAVFWFSPLSWWLHRRLVGLTELASDDQAIAAIPDPLRYAEILLEMGWRTGLSCRGPAMARLSTLPYRIDRILNGQASLPAAPASRQVLLAAAVGGVSLAVASVTPMVISGPALTLLAMQPGSGDGGIELGPRNADQGKAVEPVAAVMAPSLAVAAELAMQAQSGASPALVEGAARPAKLPLRRVAPAPVPRMVVGPPQAGAGQGGKEGRPGSPVARARELARPMAGPDASIGMPADVDASASLSQQIGFRVRTPAGREFPGVVGRTCTGTLGVGPGVWKSATTNQPDVVAGQRVPIRAQFFRRHDETPWVRFDVFGRPALDLPVHPDRMGMTWTGEYGISYTVQDLGRGHLVGLAGRVLNDSASLNLDCTGSAH